MADQSLPSGPRVETLSTKTVFKGYFRVDEWLLRHVRFGGGWSGEIKREVFERGHAVAVLLYDPVRDEVALIRQFRVGALAAGWDPWLYEIVAGIVEPDELPEEVARRETIEEAGCTAITSLIPMMRFLVTAGASTESVHMYCGLIDTTGLGGIHGLEHENEDIQVVVLSCADALDMLQDGRANNSPIIIALQWLALNRDRLRRGDIPPPPGNWPDVLEPGRPQS